MILNVIIACHNRRALTVRCIEKTKAAADYSSAKISFTLFDDGSTDGTADAVSDLPVEIRTLKGDGSAYWASSMAQAEATVVGNPELSREGLLVWLNDDVDLDIDAFARLRPYIESNPSAVIVGAMRDPVTRATTYSGMRRTGFHPLKFDVVAPTTSLQQVDTFNGNFVVVPLAVARQLGGIDGGFSHALADIDYGLRCQASKVPLLLAPGTFGTCPRNETPPRGKATADWRVFVSAKGGGNLHSLVRILRKTNRLSWPMLIASTYGLWWLRRLAAEVRSKATL